MLRQAVRPVAAPAWRGQMRSSFRRATSTAGIASGPSSRRTVHERGDSLRPRSLDGVAQRPRDPAARCCCWRCFGLAGDRAAGRGGAAADQLRRHRRAGGAGGGQHRRPPRRCAAARRPTFPFPEPPPGSPFEDFFREFFDRDRRRSRRRSGSRRSARASWSTRAGYVVTNNHVIAEADEIQVVFGDETDLRGQADRPRPEDRSGAAQDRGRQAVPGGDLRRQRPASGSATGSSRSAIRSASAAR